MPETTTKGPEEQLAVLMRLAQMKRGDNNTGRCGEPPEWCFQLFAAPMTVARTGAPAVDASLDALRSSLLATWQDGRAAVKEAAAAAFPGHDWDVEWAFADDNTQLICTRRVG